MEFNEFIKQISQQRINVRDRVTVATNTYQLTGTLVPCDIVISRDGQTLSKVCHCRNGQLMISVKTIPDRMCPDVGTPIPISDIVSIRKEI